MKRGSITVEAAFIVPCCLFVICAILTLCFYLHNRAWYTAAAGETAVSAATAAVRKSGEYEAVLAEKTAALRGTNGFLDACQGLTYTADRSKITVEASAKTPFLWGKGSYAMQVREGVKVIRPVKFIRRVQALKVIKENSNAG